MDTETRCSSIATLRPRHTSNAYGRGMQFETGGVSSGFCLEQLVSLPTACAAAPRPLNDDSCSASLNIGLGAIAKSMSLTSDDISATTTGRPLRTPLNHLSLLRTPHLPATRLPTRNRSGQPGQPPRFSPVSSDAWPTCGCAHLPFEQSPSGGATSPSGPVQTTAILDNLRRQVCANFLCGTVAQTVEQYLVAARPGQSRSQN